jgi:2-succinyl-5-enolpyruvyl-6-hydroxy-3-cyclohexene-1-carboxylate synthase
MAVLQPLIDLVELCSQQGITRAVISPGSRSAALTLAFARNPHIQCTVVMDERAGAFVALGMAQQLQQPVVLVCTSGSAGYNFAPAVAEAFFQQIPLLVLTADRPLEWIHQNDGQTIYQNNLYGPHVKAAYQLPADYAHRDTLWFMNRTINEAILTAREFPMGPVQVNVPIREPFYPLPDEPFRPSGTIRKITRIRGASHLPTEAWHDLLNQWEDSERILIAVGQNIMEPELGEALKKIAEDLRIPVVGDVTSNLPTHDLFITKHELFLGVGDPSILRPDLLITCGQSFVSKTFKQFIQANPPGQHWHISEDKHVIDTFQSLTTHITVAPEYFFTKLFEDLDYHRFIQNDDEVQDERFLEDWVGYERKSLAGMHQFLSKLTVLTDITSLYFVLSALPPQSILHVGNSMSIRYVNQLGDENKSNRVFCNRGTSGIDGCVSTAIGAAIISQENVYLVVGDVAFFYDRNGLLIRNFAGNLKIVLVNNSGGTIFRLIDGPGRQPELETYFETRHVFSARRTAEDAGMAYYSVEDLESLKSTWKVFAEKEGPALLEIKTDPEVNAIQYKEWKAYLAAIF